MIIADKCLDKFFYQSLLNAGFDVLIISQTQTSIIDEKIIELSMIEKAIIITEDRDFGRFIFSDKIFCHAIIYLRKYEKHEMKGILDLLFKLLKSADELEGNLVVIKNLKLRKRKYNL